MFVAHETIGSRPLDHALTSTRFGTTGREKSECSNGADSRKIEPETREAVTSPCNMEQRERERKREKEKRRAMNRERREGRERFVETASETSNPKRVKQKL